MNPTLGPGAFFFEKDWAAGRFSFVAESPFWVAVRNSDLRSSLYLNFL